MNATSDVPTRRPVLRRLPLGAALLAVGVLTACSGGSPDTRAAQSSAVPPVAETTSPSTPVEVSPADGGATTAGVAGTPTVAPSPAPAKVPVTDGPRPAQADVELTFLGWDAPTSAVQAGGYVSPAVEAGGVCTLELTQGSRTVTATSAGEPDASTTVCGGLSVPRSKLAAGSWTGVLHYSSKKTSGTSNPATVRVPQ